MINYFIYTICALITVLLLAFCTQYISFDKASAVPTVRSNTTIAPNNNATITIHTTNSIQGSNPYVLNQEEPVIRKVILSNVDDAIFIAKGSVKSAFPVNVNAKIINQLANGRVDTTQGIDMTKRLIATELVNVINATTPNFESHFVRPMRVVVDNQAICNGIVSSTKASCSLTINLHG
jgi:hypothetical protein